MVPGTESRSTLYYCLVNGGQKTTLERYGPCSAESTVTTLAVAAAECTERDYAEESSSLPLKYYFSWYESDQATDPPVGLAVSRACHKELVAVLAGLLGQLRSKRQLVSQNLLKHGLGIERSFFHLRAFAFLDGLLVGFQLVLYVSKFLLRVLHEFFT